MILVTLTSLSRSFHFQGHHILETVKSAFSEVCLLNQWGFLSLVIIDEFQPVSL